MSVRELRINNFDIEGQFSVTLRGYQGRVAFVVFTANTCQHCPAMMDAVRRSAQAFGGSVDFAYMNLESDTAVGQFLTSVSTKTSTPITTVPAAVLYVDGAPHSVYNGVHTHEAVHRFIVEAVKQPQQQQPTDYGRTPDYGQQWGAYHPHASPPHAPELRRQQPPPQQQPPQESCTGHECYLTFNNAYNKTS